MRVPEKCLDPKDGTQAKGDIASRAHGVYTGLKALGRGVTVTDTQYCFSGNDYYDYYSFIVLEYGVCT